MIPTYRKCFKEIYNKWKIKFTDKDLSFIMKQIGTNNTEFKANLIQRFGEEYQRILLDCVENEYSKQVELEDNAFFPNAAQVLRQLRKENWNLAICTNAPTYYLEKIRSRYKLNEYFDKFYWAGLYPGKSKTWMVVEILKSFKTREAVVIGDHKHDIQAAKENNLISVGCLYGFAPDEARKADYTITDLIQLPGLLQKIKKGK
jgi:HAD superfamily hydrolase (TIGR01549 family)